MTDQRQIDVSELRDGDIVRAKRGEHGVVEGVFCRTGRGGWCLHDGPPEPPVGSVYVLVGIVWHHQAEGHVPASPVRVNGPWAGIRTWKEQRSLYNVRQLATLHILGTVD